MNKFYFYPKIDYQSISSPNPYTILFEQALEEHHQVVNKENNRLGVLDLFRFFPKVQWYVFNWIENLPAYRWGRIQLIFLLLFFWMARLFNKKVLWVMHNKYAHDVEKNAWTDFMYKTMMKYADIILTHSNEGVRFGYQEYPRYAYKIQYMIHPVQAPFKLKTATTDLEYDCLIWGTIHPYKGIIPFLDYLKNSPMAAFTKVLIVGKCFDEVYKKRLETYQSDKICIKEGYHSMENIVSFASQAQYILFTYNADSVLSSGSLMDSIRMGKTILGPAIGAFKDLEEYPFIKTYQSFEDLPSILNRQSFQNPVDQQSIRSFCKAHSWSVFADQLNVLIGRFESGLIKREPKLESETSQG